MLFCFKISIPVETGNEEAHNGFQSIQKILAEQKPEAVYFLTNSVGERSALMFKSMTDMSELPAISEPWFLALDAAIEVEPAMTPQDLMKAAPAIAEAVKKYGG